MPPLEAAACGTPLMLGPFYRYTHVRGRLHVQIHLHARIHLHVRGDGVCMNAAARAICGNVQWCTCSA